MSKVKRWCLLSFFVIAAALCYLSGLASGALGFIIAGAVFETLFWLRLFVKEPTR